ncbi:mitochondrial arginine transporter BAC2 [Cinnamomum micranthum f. kanehirae]|uniref:Mitochondrial arginine transporter BAC2 n=1 Tax=Cinnamomum micranthum f. kanehirae TaxID=337451 RepID=A0A3S3PS06_9MAGN|nr:mitochondrial arginine transporter BAC2 [Cinnamomum micranthum f. kanehirae]
MLKFVRLVKVLDSLKLQCMCILEAIFGVIDMDPAPGLEETTEGEEEANENAMVFQAYAVLPLAHDSNSRSDPPSYKSVALGGVGAAALQSFILV